MEYIEHFIEQDMLAWKMSDSGFTLEITGSRQVST